MEAVQLTRRTDGKIRATDEQKRALLDLLNQGKPIAEVARAHGMAIQTLVKWRRGDVKRAMRFEKQVVAEVNPGNAKEMLAEIRRLCDENQKLRKAIGNVAYDRDILQEAYNIAVKKKWI
jgi:transposase-like protein